MRWKKDVFEYVMPSDCAQRSEEDFSPQHQSMNQLINQVTNRSGIGFYAEGEYEV